MHRVIGLCGFFLSMVGLAIAKPLSGGANLSALIEMSRLSRTASLPPAPLAWAQAHEQSDDLDAKMVAMLLLAHTDDTESRAMLQRATAKDKDAMVAGAALYALCMRDTRALANGDAECSATFALGRVSNPYARLFLATRLHHYFGETAMAALLAAARDEQDPIVQVVLLHYLSASSNAAILRALAEMPWPTTVAIPENLIAVLHALHPGSFPLTPVSRSAHILQQVNGKLQDKYKKYLLDAWTEAWWARQSERHSAGINTLAHTVDLARMEDTARRIDQQYVGGTLQVCRLLTNAVTGMEFSEGRHAVGARLLRGLLQQAETLALSQEIAIVECLTQFGPGHQRAMTDQEWGAQRRINAPLVLHAWQRILVTSEPNFDMNQVLPLHADLPAGVYLPHGVAPEAIEDAELRAQYEANIAQHRQRIEQYNEQQYVRKLQQTFVPMAERYLIALYAHLPDDREACVTLLDTYGLDVQTTSRLVKAVNTALDRQQQ